MTCQRCGNQAAYHITSWYDRATEKMVEVCDGCGGDRRGVIPTHSDVYWPGAPHRNPNICDDIGRPILLESREHKARVMKELGIREAGDRTRGSNSQF